MIKFWVISMRGNWKNRVPVAARSSYEEAKNLAQTLAKLYVSEIKLQESSGSAGETLRIFPANVPPGYIGALVSVDPIELDVAVPDWALDLVEWGRD